MTQEDIVAVCKVGREKAAEDSFAQTPLNPEHVKRLRELQEARHVHWWLTEGWGR